MGVDTKGITTKQVDISDVVNAVKTVFDPSAKHDLEKRDCYENDFMGCVYFEHEGKPHSVFVCKTADKAADTEFDGVLHTNFIAGCYDGSVEIIRKLVGYFGGYVDDNDCDDIGYYKVDQDGTVHPPILEVTWNEIYEKFGRVVKIKE